MAAKLPNTELLKQTGHIRIDFLDPGSIFSDSRRALRIKDEAEFIHRYKWEGLPKEISAELLERILYYRGQAMLFKNGDDEEALFLFLPYAVSGPFDCYGRPNQLKPVIFGGSTSTKDKDGEENKVDKVFMDVYFNPVYEEEAKISDRPCVILKDYTPQLSDYIISRSVLQEHAIGMEAEALPFARTSRIANSGVRGMRVNDEGASNNVKMANQAIVKAAIKGDALVPIVDEIEFQDLGLNSGETPEGSLMYMQSIDHYRQSLMGVKNTGVYEKKAHVLEGEEKVNEESDQSVLLDGLNNRKRFCEIANKVYGLNMSVSIDEENDKPEEEEQEEKKEVNEDAE